MKKPLLGFLLLAPWLALAQASTPYTVKGKIGGLNAPAKPAKIYLVRGLELLDSTTLKNGAFAFKGTTDRPKIAQLVVQRAGKLKDAHFLSSNRTRIFLEPGPVVVTTADSLPNASFTGSQLTTDYQKLMASFKPIEAKVAAIIAGAEKASPQQRQEPAFQEHLQAQFQAIDKERQQGYAAFIKANPTSWVSLDAMPDAVGIVPQYAELEPLYNALSPTLQSSPEGQRYQQLLHDIQAVAIGAQAPDFTQQTLDGKQISLTDYRGKYVLVDFWASWCGPCRQENPTMTKVYNEFKNKNFDILAVSLDEKKGNWLKAVQEDQLAWTQVLDPRGFESDIARRYHIQAIPQNFLVDPTGRIVATNLRGDELRATLARFIK